MNHKHFSYDATRSEMLGKYINHSKNHANAKAKLVNGSICLFAIKDLPPGMEIRYNYGVHNLIWKVNSFYNPQITRDN